MALMQTIFSVLVRINLLIDYGNPWVKSAKRLSNKINKQ